MNKALLLFWHGLGDLICCTPALRALYEQGYLCDIIALPITADSHLIDACPYTGKIIPHKAGASPSVGGEKGRNARASFINVWNEMKSGYDKAFKFQQTPSYLRGGKIERNFKSCELPINLDTTLEVFITQEAEDTARSYIDSNFPNGFIFKHTYPGHEVHAWPEGDDWIKENLPDLPVFDCGREPTKLFPRNRENAKYKFWPDINVTFVMAREAKHRVLCSSVFMHACDAMNLEVDVCHYGGANYHGLPLDPRKIKVMHGFDHSRARDVWPKKS